MDSIKPYVNHLGGEASGGADALGCDLAAVCKVVATIGGIRVEEFLVAGVWGKDCTYRKGLFFRKGLFPRQPDHGRVCLPRL